MNTSTIGTLALKYNFDLGAIGTCLTELVAAGQIKSNQKPTCHIHNIIIKSKVDNEDYGDDITR